MPDIHGVGGEKGGVGKSTVCKRILEYLGVAIVSGQKITQDVVRGKALDSGDLPSLLSRTSLILRILSKKSIPCCYRLIMPLPVPQNLPKYK